MFEITYDMIGFDRYSIGERYRSNFSKKGIGMSIKLVIIIWS